MSLLEREHLLRLLTEYADEARTGAGRLVLVTGEAGAGKTSLVDAAEGRIAAQWLRTACDGLFTPRPLGPIFDLADLVGGDLLEAARRDASREELFTRVLHALRDPGKRLTALVIEDVHWADEPTLDLVRFLGRRLRDLPVLVILTFRDDQLGRDAPLRVCVGDLASFAGTRRLSVPPLTEAAVAELAADTGIDAAEVHHLTGGNAFLTVEVLQAGPLRAGSTPPSVRDAVLARTARLGPGSRSVLEVCALLGRLVEPDLLADVVAATGTGLVATEGRNTAPGPELVTAGLDDLVAAGLLVTDGPWLRHRHELTRLAVEGEMPPHRRAGVHAAIVGALLSRPDADPARVAHHADAAGDSALVLEYAPRAAARASALAAHREAATEYTRALRHSGAAPDLVRAGLLHELAVELTLIDEWPDAERAHEEALAVWRQVGDVHRQGDELWRIARLQGSPEAARLTALRAVELLEPLGPSEPLAWARTMAAAAAMQAGAAAEALEDCRQSKALADLLILPAVRSSALNTEACVRAALGEPGWADQLQEALDVALENGDAMQAARAYTNLVGTHAGRCEFAAVEHWYLEGSAFCDDHDIGTYGNCIRGYRALSLVPQGRWEEALAVAGDILRSSRSPANRAEALLAMATVQSRRAGSNAAATVQQLHDEALRSGSGYWVAVADLARAESHWVVGDTEAARAALPPLNAEGVLSDAWERSNLRAWWQRISGEAVEAPADAPGPYALMFAGDVEGAVAAWDRLGCPYDAALTHLDAATHHRPNTEQHLRHALARLEALGAAATADVVRARMREHGMKRIPRPARAATQAHPLGLTAREHDVLELLAQGQSNAAISERLFISPKTVDHHVSAVLTKLGVASRGAAVAAAQRSGVLPAAR
ncbi:MAG: helix-turn-helix transcriptional regulator [Intrasporangium sp.]|uniref:helix-turn-helix transcriptional regulator n=1 Tax=Intrasporangium sp. TaxID=1925024 RepID=UPI003F7DE1B7